MAPNRKSIIAFEHSLEDLENLQNKLWPTISHSLIDMSEQQEATGS
jgi:hypothetical protein